MENQNARDLKSLLDFIPSLQDKSILQLGSEVASTKVFLDQNVKSLVVVDSSSENLETNRIDNAASNKVVFANKNLNEIEDNENKFDFIYSDSKFIDFSEEMIQMAVEKSLRILNNNSMLLLREPFDVTKSKIFYEKKLK